MKLKLTAFFLFIISCAFAQQSKRDSLCKEMLFVSTVERQEIIVELEKFYPQDSVGLHAMYEDIGGFGKKHGDKLMELTMLSGYLRLANESKNTSNERYKSLIDSVYLVYEENRPGDVFMAGMERHLGNFYRTRENNYALAFQHYHKGFDLIQSVDIEKYPYKIQEALALVYLHYDFNDFDKAIYYAQETLKEKAKIKERNLVASLQMHMGYSFRDLGQLDSSDVYFRKAISESQAWGDKIQEGTGYCYLGYNFYLRNDLEAAERLFIKGVDFIGNDVNMKPVKVLFTSYLADINSQKNDKTLTKKFVAELKRLGASNAYRGNQAAVYKNLSKVYARQGESESALMYLDSMEQAEEYMRVNFDSKRFLRTQQQEEIKKIEDKNLKLIFWRDASLGFLGILFAVSLVIYLIRIRRKNEELITIQRELERSKSELEKFSLNLKNNTAKTLQENPSANSEETLQILEESTILTSDEWNDFKNHFTKVYPHFFKGLNDSYPNLTQGEIRFLSLKKLGFSNKEMADTLGVSDQSIRTTLYRLRKNLDLSSEDDIATILESI